MGPGFYKRLENKFRDNVSCLIKGIPLFLKNNYLFFCIFLAFVWFLYAFYPGAIAFDTFLIYSDAYHNTVRNLHSALTTRLWQVILFFTDFAGIFVLIQLAAICLGLYIIARNISKNIITGIICVLILFVPPVFADIMVVVKDTYLAAFTFLIAALMLDKAISNKSKTLLFCITSSIILIMCFYVRPNGCFIAVPLLVAIFMGWKAPIIYRYIICLVVVLCVVSTTAFVELKLLKARDYAPDFSLLLFDIVGTSKNAGQTMFPDIPEVSDQMAIIDRCYTPLQWDTISYWGKGENCNAIAMHFLNDAMHNKGVDQTRHELQEAWKTAIIKHPLAYLKHRIDHFNRFLVYKGHEIVYRPTYIGKEFGYIGFSENDALTYKVLPPKIWEKFIQIDLKSQLWFHPYVFLLILLFFYLSTLATSDRFNRTLNVVAFSGMIYLVGFLFVGVSSDFRYSYPSLLLSILCILAAFGYYSQRRRVFGNKRMRIIAVSVTVPLFLIGIIL